MNEDSGEAGMSGTGHDNSQTSSGAVYIFTWTPQGWTPGPYIKAPNPGSGDGFAYVALDAAGTTLAVGAPFEDSASTEIGGDQTDDSAPNAGAVYLY